MIRISSIKLGSGEIAGKNTQIMIATNIRKFLTKKKIKANVSIIQ